MSIVVALLLSLVLGKLVRRDLVYIRKWFCSSWGIRNRDFPVWAAGQDRNHKHVFNLDKWAGQNGEFVQPIRW